MTLLFYRFSSVIIWWSELRRLFRSWKRHHTNFYSSRWRPEFSSLIVFKGLHRWHSKRTVLQLQYSTAAFTLSHLILVNFERRFRKELKEALFWYRNGLLLAFIECVSPALEVLPSLSITIESGLHLEPSSRYSATNVAALCICLPSADTVAIRPDHECNCLESFSDYDIRKTPMSPLTNTQPHVLHPRWPRKMKDPVILCKTFISVFSATLHVGLLFIISYTPSLKCDGFDEVSWSFKWNLHGIDFEVHVFDRSENLK